MASPLTLPIARLRAAGCKVGHIVGHDPITTGAHPRFVGKWQYSITTPEPVANLFEKLYRWDHSWSDQYGAAIARTVPDGRIIVEAFASDLEHHKDLGLRDYRQCVESDVATLLGRIATVISNGKV